MTNGSHTSLTLLLASSSPARHATLAAAGIQHDVLPAQVDERQIEAGLRAAGEDAPARIVQELARAKALAVAEQVLAAGNPQGYPVIVGCDSLFALAGHTYGKPHSPAEAARRLRLMSGHPGVLYTGHYVVDLAAERSAAGGGLHTAQGVSQATVYMSELSEAEIAAYIASGEPLEVAGSFTLDGRGGPFIERIEGDPHGVVGISLPLLRKLLGELGYSVTHFWPAA